MAQYLSDEWFDEMGKAAGTFIGDADQARPVTLRETITGSPFGTITYLMTIDGISVGIDRDSDAVADVTFTQTYETAVALHKGELTTQDAFFAGNVRVAGHLNTLLDNSDLLQGIAPIFESVRVSTTY